jgi:hypothetical protein
VRRNPGSKAREKLSFVVAKAERPAARVHRPNMGMRAHKSNGIVARVNVIACSCSHSGGLL